jgi:nucleoside triphosphate pyrophosphatase
VLASASPRRRELLTALGVEFEVVATGVAEITRGEPQDVVLANARAKALVGQELAGSDRAVLGVDTDVVIDGEVLGKPGTAQEAETALRTLSARKHEVISALVVLGPASSPERHALEHTTVRFRALSEQMIRLYLASEEWRDRAGGYAVQGLGAMFVEKIEGDLANVIGMPIQAFAQLAPEFLPKP